MTQTKPSGTAEVKQNGGRAGARWGCARHGRLSGKACLSHVLRVGLWVRRAVDGLYWEVLVKAGGWGKSHLIKLPAGPQGPVRCPLTLHPPLPIPPSAPPLPGPVPIFTWAAASSPTSFWPVLHPTARNIFETCRWGGIPRTPNVLHSTASVTSWVWPGACLFDSQTVLEQVSSR